MELTHSAQSQGNLPIAWRFVYTNHKTSVKFARRGPYSGESWPVQQLAERLGGKATQRLFTFDFQRTLSGAEGGDRSSMFDLGKAYIEGRGVEKNREEGARWMRLSAAAGDSRAMTYLKQNSWAQDTGAKNQ